MPPEQPPYLVILDVSFGAGGLEGRAEYVKPVEGRLQVRWGVGSPPAGYKEKGGGVVFVASESASSPPPDENPSIQVEKGRYVYEEGLCGALWLMLVIILPQAYVLSDPDPATAGVRLFGDRLAAYWRLSKTGVPDFIQVKWGLQVGDVHQTLQSSQSLAPLPFDGGEAAPAFGAFLSYRRESDEWAVGRIRDRLIHSFGNAAVFRDIDSIEAGTDFRQEIDDGVGKCKVMLAVIGHSWLDSPRPIGERRIDSERDWVRIEIESALQRHRSIIPVLLDETQMPDETLLPDSLRELAFRQACRLRERTFDADIQRLIAALRKHIDSTRTHSAV